MSLDKGNTCNPIRGCIQLNQTQRNACLGVIDLFTFDDLARGAGTLHAPRGNIARLDLQGHTADGEINLQVQIGSSSVAAVLIAPSVLQIQDAWNQVGGQKAVIAALKESLYSQTIWQLTGTLP